MSPNLARLVEGWSIATESLSCHANYRAYAWARTHGASERHDIHAALQRFPRGSWGGYGNSRRLRHGVEVHFRQVGTRGRGWYQSGVSRVADNRTGWQSMPGASPALAGRE